MKKNDQTFSTSRRNFLATTGSVLGAALVTSNTASALTPSTSSGASASADMAKERPAGNLRKIPIGVFDPVYADLSIDQMLDVVTGLGLEVMEIGTGGYPGNKHCALDDLIAEPAKAHAWQKRFTDRGIRIATLSCHGNPVHPDPAIAARDADTFRKTVLLAEMLEVKS